MYGDFDSATEENDNYDCPNPNNYISPFAVCGGTRIGSFREAYMKQKSIKHKPDDKNAALKRKQFQSVYAFDPKTEPTSDPLMETPEERKVSHP